MAASPHVLIQDGSGSFINPDSPGDLNYPAGVNVTPGNTISIKLLSADSVGNWNLKVIGTDEETTHPTLVGVDPTTGVVSTPSTVVTLVVPAGAAGRAYIFQSVVNNGGPAYTTTFGIYTLTTSLFRVGAVGERLENDSIFGWTRTLNQFIKRGGGGGGGAVPPLAHVRYAALIENPLGFSNWELLTDDRVVGGYRAVANATARNAIPSVFLKTGMLVQTLDDSLIWKLESNLTTWTLMGVNGAASGDLSGNYPNPNVVAIQGVGVTATPPTSRQIILASDSTHAIWSQLTQDDILPGFAIVSFTPAGTLYTAQIELGVTVSGMTAGASYTSGPPISGIITNSMGGSSGGGDIAPGSWTFNAPFSAGSMAGTIKRTGVGAAPTWTITLSVTGATVKSTSGTVTWLPRVYHGVSAVGTYNSSFITSLATNGLQASRLTTYTDTAGSGQYLYYATPTIYGTPTFWIGGFSYPGTMVAGPIVVNTTGVAINYDLWQVVNTPNLGITTVTVT
jgi:hypothetical protein